MDIKKYNNSNKSISSNILSNLIVITINTKTAVWSNNIFISIW